MGIIILFIAMVVVFWTIWTLLWLNPKYRYADMCCTHREETRAKALLYGIGTIAILMSIALFTTCVFIMVVHLPSDTVHYNKMEMRRDMLQYRVEHIDENAVGNELLYNDIVAFNTELYDIKRKADNKWVNWFVVDEIADMDYIEIEDKNDTE